MKQKSLQKPIWSVILIIFIIVISSCSSTPSVIVRLPNGGTAEATNALNNLYKVGDTVELLEVQQLRKAMYHEIMVVGYYKGRQLDPVSSNGKVATAWNWGIITKVNN